MKEKINECYKRLQMLSIAPTRGNMEILLQTLYDLQLVYKALEESENAGAENGSADHSEGRNNP